MSKIFTPAAGSTAARVLDTNASPDPEAGRIPPPRANRDWWQARRVLRNGHAGQVAPLKRAA